MGEIQIGQIGLSVLITVLMGIIYKFFENPDGSSSIADKWKTLIVIVVGMGLSVVAMIYNATAWTAQNIISYLVNGFMSGCAAIGLWKGLGAVNTKQ
jgi:uncharacterized membrane-anchored protein